MFYNKIIDELNENTSGCHYFVVTYSNLEDNSIRTLILYAISGYINQWKSIAEQFKAKNEEVIEIEEISEEEYMEWFGKGKQYIEILNNHIPIEFIVKAIISKNRPTKEHLISGNILKEKILLEEKDIDLLEYIHKLWLESNK